MFGCPCSWCLVPSYSESTRNILAETIKVICHIVIMGDPKPLNSRETVVGLS